VLQRGVPFGFQAAGGQPVLEIKGAVAPFSPEGVVSSLLESAAVLGECSSWPCSSCSAACRLACSAVG
jgi:hypothetical protein